MHQQDFARLQRRTMDQRMVGGGGTNARITRDVLAGETYLIGANSLNAAVTGSYSVSVQTGAFMIVGTGQTVAPTKQDEAIARAKLGRFVKTLR